MVLDFFDAVPVTETQSPAARELTASVTVLENCVVGVQLTVVCPELAFCTSMLEPLRAATLPEAPVGRVVERGGGPGGATPAASGREQRVAPASGEAHPAPTVRASAGRCLHRGSFLFLFLFLCRVSDGARSVSYSLRRASIGARVAARLAG